MECIFAENKDSTGPLESGNYEVKRLLMAYYRQQLHHNYKAYNQANKKILKRLARNPQVMAEELGRPHRQRFHDCIG